VSFPIFHWRGLRFAPLAERRNKVVFPADSVSPEAAPRALSERAASAIRNTAEQITAARRKGRPVICAFVAYGQPGFFPVPAPHAAVVMISDLR